MVAPAVQLPVPLHWPAAVCDPPAHDGLVQAVVVGQSAQAPPEHLPSAPQLVAIDVAQMLRGSAVPLMALLQVPLLPPLSAAEHAWHAELHALLQQ